MKPAKGELDKLALFQQCHSPIKLSYEGTGRN
jgi:hypothetical protein